MTRLPLALLLALMACATASANILRLDDVERTSTPPDSIQFLVDEPDSLYTAIALVEVTDKGAGLSLECLRRKLRDEAAKLGGEAVILSHRTGEAGAILLPVGNQFWAFNLREQQLVGKVIVFRSKSTK